ncbi:P-loop containing nucleoside triphosphate hydrolases superfamily protein [Prunus dulcis]|uniref:P-loop containing nucleoside triphosphate hydrolases superfamily protein n=1 Tax=Prunus dulcis TaxID=3755 RepID=A0A4Y1RWN1_PRUDU|nr:P-loop containing nucleoside triphosphate hydrolases superfamily protein [Prunus dulcis]
MDPVAQNPPPAAQAHPYLLEPSSPLLPQSPLLNLEWVFFSKTCGCFNSDDLTLKALVQSDGI